jgi:hypothetical protein
MPRRKTGVRSRRTGGVALAAFRRQVHAVMQQLQRAGRQQLRAIDRQIEALNEERRDLLAEIGPATDSRGAGAPPAGRATATRGGRRGRKNWQRVFTQLPAEKAFKASDLRALVPGVEPRTISRHLARWVEEKKLRRTGAKRGTRYLKV